MSYPLATLSIGIITLGLMQSCDWIGQGEQSRTVITLPATDCVEACVKDQVRRAGDLGPGMVPQRLIALCETLVSETADSSCSLVFISKERK